MSHGHVLGFPSQGFRTRAPDTSDLRKTNENARLRPFSCLARGRRPSLGCSPPRALSESRLEKGRATWGHIYER